ncbi:MAG: transposase [Nitrososphaerota archaeon]|nr:transposase [Nitrososphaerota archaeon]
MSGKSRQSGDSRISVRTMFHARKVNLIKFDPDALKELERLLERSQLLAAAYRFGQRVYSAHDKRHLTPDVARKRILKAWAALPPEALKHFSKFRTAIFERSEEYFNNWKEGAISNGVTEAINRTLRDIYRAGRGLRYEEMRMRAIYSASPRERMRRRKNGELDPIAKAKAIINGASIPKSVRRVTRHGLHRRGKRSWQVSPSQMSLFSEEDE